ncbi:UPF0605 protein CG18335 [Harpegnathos saltator]|uniref:UPF0605 protein CG18335 n=1 Tax=Harpegnathos saltator TaxID=610380 RepID=E2BA78_HARSA|nr:UPF0605 protein CG18335 [Harpegnathos saltator]
MELLTTPEPHLIPGYAGYCPQYRFRCGETFAKTTHKLLLDPTVDHADMLILSSRAATENSLNIGRYLGFLPRSGSRYGQRFAVNATEQVAEFERQQLRHKEARDRLRRRIESRDSQDRSVGYAKYDNARSSTPPFKSLLHDCTTTYREEVTMSGPDPPILVQPNEIYHKHVGLIPNYLGHVPGAVFRQVMNDYE